MLKIIPFMFTKPFFTHKLHIRVLDNKLMGECVVHKFVRVFRPRKRCRTIHTVRPLLYPLLTTKRPEVER